MKTKMELLTEELNEKFMKDQTVHFICQRGNTVTLVHKKCEFRNERGNTESCQISGEGQNKIDSYLKEKYEVIATWHHGYCFGIYQGGDHHPKFL